MQRKKSRGGAVRKFFAPIFWGFALRVIVLLVVFWLLMWAVFGDSIPYWGYINAAAILVGLASLLTTILFFVRRERYWGLFSLIAALAILLPGNGHNFGQLFANESVKSEDSLRIVSASLRGRNKDMVSAARRLLEYNPDIVAAQEIADRRLLLYELNKQSGLVWKFVAKGTLAIFSKSEITLASSSKVPSAEAASVLKAEVMLDGMKASIWTLRAPKNYERPVVNAGFYAALARMISSEQPDVVLGDFNGTYWNDGFGKIARYMENAHAESGIAFGNSFPARGRISGLLGPYVRIDHIFVGQRYDSIAAFTGDASAGADHHPVIADIRPVQD